jgi:lysophospholipase L1-like esterase
VRGALSAAGPVRGASRRLWLLRCTALAAVPALLLPGCDRSPYQGPPLQPVPRAAPVLALGDSLTHGTGAAPEASYPAELARLTGWQVTNAGVPGDTSAGALQRLPGLLAQGTPRLVLLSIGGNDLLRRLPVEDLKNNVRAMVRLCREAGAQVLLIAVPEPSAAAAFFGGLTDHRLYAALAEELQLPLQRQGWSDVLSNETLRSDRLHANARGYRQFAQALRATALAVGLLARPA